MKKLRRIARRQSKAFAKAVHSAFQPHLTNFDIHGSQGQNMNERQIQLVQHSFERASRIGAHLAATFYAELFAIDPSLRGMFKGDMIVQGQKLLNTLRFVVENLRQTETLLPVVRTLALKHLDYGVEAQHYSHVGIALMRTMKHELAAEFTPEAHQAWRAAYQLLADAMIGAAYPHLASRGA